MDKKQQIEEARDRVNRKKPNRDHSSERFTRNIENKLDTDAYIDIIKNGDGVLTIAPNFNE